MRAFYALPLWNRLDLGEIKDTLGSHGLRWVSEHQLHLTLHYLGEIAGEQLPEAAALLRRAARCFPPFSLTWDRTGVFPHWNSPKVYWIGICQPQAGQLAKLGAVLGNPRFQAHVTVARVKGTVPAMAVDKWKKTEILRATVDVDSLCLVKSTLTPHGPIYEVLERAVLEGERQP